MNKAGIIGIVVAGIIIGILAIFSLNSFSITGDTDEVSESILEREDSGLESKPQGRDLSIELDEKMGLSAP